MVTCKLGKISKEWTKIVHLLVLFLVSLLIISAKGQAQERCDLSQHVMFPPTPYSNAYLNFDGTGDYLKTNDINSLEFDTASTGSFVIETRFKIKKVLSPQFITGKYYGKGWILGYHTDEGGYVSVTFSGGWKRVYNLGSDTTWHDYKIIYNKASRILTTFVDGNQTYTYTDFTYGNIQNISAFSVGNVGFLPNYGPQSINMYSNWFKGSVDYVKISANSVNIVNYDFNECAGQFTKDSASYTINDRTLPGEQSCGAQHMMLGYNPCEDTCDPGWVQDDIDKPTSFSALGSGLRSITIEGGFPVISMATPTGMTEWNNYLVSCGSFNNAGGVPAKNIAKWDGVEWSPIGGGFNYEPHQVITYRNELYATGYFDSAIGFGEMQHIAKWNGSAWEPLGRGLTEAGLTMTVFNDELIVGGYFISSGEVYSPRVARWNGIEWKPMAFGMSGPVYSLCIYNGELYAGGNFVYAGTVTCNGVAKWNGTTWEALGIGVYGGEKTVRKLKVYNNELYAGGSFIYMDGVSCHNIAKYNGSSWTGLQGGAKGYNCTSSQGLVTDLEILDNELYTVGLFTRIGSISANKIAKWNGSNWCSIEFGIDLLPRDLEVYQGSLIITGDLQSVSGKPYNHITSYTPKAIITGNGNNSEIPKTFELKQNYPNPFNPATKIKYNVSGTGSNIKIVVYDVQGGEIQALVNQRQNAGSYEISFNGSSLSSGVYFYSMFADGQLLATKKMLMIK
jgi:hypothetical protein